jgi:hypothetical protein
MAGGNSRLVAEWRINVQYFTLAATFRGEHDSV